VANTPIAEKEYFIPLVVEKEVKPSGKQKVIDFIIA